MIKEPKIKSVNSLSGGRTSSYIAAHFPADYEIFALVCADNHNVNAVKIDKNIKQIVNDKLQKYCSHMPEFQGTTEDPIILRTMLDLEQHIGREIIWLRGMGWEEMIRKKKAIPNKSKRFCTTILKMIPIFEFLYKYTELPVNMRIGYRYDEKERADNFDEFFKYPLRSEYREKSNTWINRWESLNWRKGDFPLIDNKVVHYTVVKYWKKIEDSGLIQFADDSNCQNCFWKDPQQLRKNFDTNPSIMYWAAIQEELANHTFKDENSLLELKNIGLQLDFFFGTGSGCQAGFCTN